MSSRGKKTQTDDDPDVLRLQQGKNQTEAEVLAEAALRPSLQATLSLREYGKTFGDLSIEGLMTKLQDQIDATADGDLGRGEAMLTAQAHTLDAIFNNLARRAINAEYMKNLEIYLKLGLRAQSQCRATWEAISTMKNPPVAGYVGQANIAHGPQQVNNKGDAPGADSRARETEKPKNELLEEQHVERLDTGTASTSGRNDPALAPVGEVNGSEDP